MKKSHLKTRHALLMSCISLMTCFAMLVGATFAWFTDSVTSGVNKIQAGNLDIDVLHTSASVTNAESISAQTNLFRDASGNAMLWEPGAVSYEKFTVKNLGTLALKYSMAMNVAGYNKVKDTEYSLLDVLKVAILEGTDASSFAGTREAAAALTYSGTLSSFTKSGYLLAGGTSSDATFTVVIYWQPTDNDNNWNVNNDKRTSDGNPALWIDLGINVVATQKDHEYDSFGNQYDVTAENQLPAIGTTVSATKSNTEIGENDAVLTTELATVTVPKGNLPEDPAYSLRLDVKRVENNVTDNAGAVAAAAAGNTLVTYDVSLVKIVDTTETKMEDSSKVYTVSLFIGKGNDLVKFYHKGTEVTEFNYDPNTGYITYKTNSFSPYAAEIKFAGGLGTEQYPYVIDGVKMWKALVDATENDASYAATAGKYFSVTSDIDVSSYSERMNIHYFAGHIDFNNHELRGYNANNIVPGDIGDDGLAAVFSMIRGDVEIANLKFVTSGVGSDASHVVAVSVTGVSYNAVDVTFKNVDTYGTVTGATGNNNSLLLAYVFMASCKVTCIDCDNYATVIGSGYRSAFIGNMGYPSSYNANVDPTQVTFTNCHNYGTIVSTSQKASMLLSNDGYPSQDVTVTITNCSNKGAIISENDSNLKVNNAGSGLTKYKFTGDVTGHPVQTLTTTTLGTNNGNFVLNPTNGAVRYELNFSFTARSHAGGNVGYVIPIEASKTLPADIFVGEWLTKEEAKATGEDVVNHGTYYTCGSNYVFYEDGARFEYGRQVLATFIAYGENNEMLSIATYTYPAVNK